MLQTTTAFIAEAFTLPAHTHTKQMTYAAALCVLMMLACSFVLYINVFGQIKL